MLIWTSDRDSKIETSTFALCGKVEEAPSARKLAYYGRFPLIAIPVPVPEAPGISLVKFAQFWPTFGNSIMVCAVKVVLCSPVSVFNKVACSVTWTSC